MKTIFLASVLGIGLLVSTGVSAADAPAGATALCKDGTYYTNATHKGACKGHQGVKTWLDKSSDTAPAAAKPATKAAAAPKATTTKTAAAKTAAAPSDSTGTPIAKCKDGTTFSGTSHRGACRGHKGVETWLDQPAAVATPAPAAPAKPAATPAAPAKTTAADAPKTPTPSSEIQQKAGGGPGKVWVNSSSKVYHCSDDQWYGKTKDGSYMTEAAAKAAGNRAARGKECGG